VVLVVPGGVPWGNFECTTLRKFKTFTMLALQDQMVLRGFFVSGENFGKTDLTDEKYIIFRKIFTGEPSLSAKKFTRWTFEKTEKKYVGLY